MSGVIWNNGERRRCRCSCHRPIGPAALRRRLLLAHVREAMLREHRDHFMYEPGCQLCAAGTPRQEAS